MRFFVGDVGGEGYALGGQDGFLRAGKGDVEGFGVCLGGCESVEGVF